MSDKVCLLLHVLLDILGEDLRGLHLARHLAAQRFHVVDHFDEQLVHVQVHLVGVGAPVRYLMVAERGGRARSQQHLLFVGERAVFVGARAACRAQRVAANAMLGAEHGRRLLLLDLGGRLLLVVLFLLLGGRCGSRGCVAATSSATAGALLCTLLLVLVFFGPVLSLIFKKKI